MLFETLVRNPRVTHERSSELKHIIAIVYNLSCSYLRSDLEHITAEDEIQKVKVLRTISSKEKAYLYFLFRVRGLIFMITTEVKVVNEVVHKDCRLAISDGTCSPGGGVSKRRGIGLNLN